MTPADDVFAVPFAPLICGPVATVVVEGPVIVALQGSITLNAGTRQAD